MYSSSLSGLQLLDNENVLITAGRKGYTFEITPQNEIVWEYITPLRNGAPVDQGTTLITNQNLTFRANRYPLDFPAFANKDISPKGFIELNPDTSFCEDIMTSTVINHQKELSINVYPNPVTDILNIQFEGREYYNLIICDMFGRKIFQDNLMPANSEISTRDLGMRSGCYFLVIDGKVVRKIIVGGD